MATYAGNSFVLQVATSAGSSSYTTVGLMQSHNFSLKNAEVDTTTKDDNRWGSSQPYGKREIDMSVSGLVSDNSAFAQIESVVETSGTNLVYKILYGNSKTITSSFIVSNLDYAGEAQDAQNVSFSMKSSGTPTFA